MGWPSPISDMTRILVKALGNEQRLSSHGVLYLFIDTRSVWWVDHWLVSLMTRRAQCDLKWLSWSHRLGSPITSRNNGFLPFNPEAGNNDDRTSESRIVWVISNTQVWSDVPLWYVRRAVSAKAPMPLADLRIRNNAVFNRLCSLPVTCCKVLMAV